MTELQTPPPPLPPHEQIEQQNEQRKGFIRLAVVAALAIGLASAFGIVKTLAVILALFVMIMLHEFGHFVMAKRAGMKCTEFFVGFGKRVWSVRKGETEYGIKAIPLGGYVKVIGMSSIEDVPPEDEPRTYRQKGYWARLSVAVAGSTVHGILAFLCLWAMFAVAGVPVAKPVISQLSQITGGPSPAEEAGFEVGDRIVSYDGRALKQWSDLPEYIQARPGTPITFEVERGERRLTLTATPVNLQDVKVDDAPVVDKPTGFIGIGPTPGIEKHGPIEAIGDAGSELWMYTKGTVVALGQIFSFQGLSDYADEVRGQGSGDGNSRFLSPVGFVRVASQAADQGWFEVLRLLALINVFVGIFNMIPLLPFDGGHVAVATYEAIRSRKGKRYMVDGRKALATAYPVVMILVLIAVTSLYLDLANPIDNPYR